DRQLIQLIISNPTLTNVQIAKLLGISKQAVSERRKRLEEEGIIQNYVFWNIVPKLSLTKQFEIVVKNVEGSQVQEVTNYLIHNWKVAFVWILNDRKTISGIILTNQEKLFKDIVKDEFPFVESIKLQPIEFKKFLGQQVLRQKKDERSLYEVANKEITKLSKKKSVNALLFSTNPKDSSVEIVVLRGKRFHKNAKMTFLDKIFNNAYVHIGYGTYGILKEIMKNKKERKRIRKLQIAFCRNKQEERKIKYLLRLAKHI
ncbi:MAG: winged helix-turn-helix domain-containing protein, partial [Candidatus Bathyarchaeia archaeon]